MAQPRHRLDRHHARLHGRRGRSCSSAGSTTQTVPFGDGHDGQARPGRPRQRRRNSTRRSSSRCPSAPSTTNHNTPHSGKAEWWSGFGDNLNSTLTRTIDLTGRDVRRRSAPGCRATSRRTTTTSTARCRPTVAPPGPRSARRSTASFAWAQKTWDLSAYTGQNVQFRFRVATDGGVLERGLPRRHRRDVDGDDRYDRRRRVRRRRLDRRSGFTHHQRHDLASRCRTSTSPRTASTAATTRR